MPERWKVAVDRQACLGSGVCAATAPRYFQLVDGKSSALAEDIDPDGIVLDVSNTCPAEAIAVYGPVGDLIAPDTT